MRPQRFDLRYRIAWDGRWHVGSGYRSATANRLQRRWANSRGAPFVPGSQVKGVLRHQCERLALALGLDVVDSHAGVEPGDPSLIKHFKPLGRSDLLVDRLFGTRYQGECLFVTNAMPSEWEARNATSVSARTAVDRVTGTVMEQRLFTTEVVDETGEGSFGLCGNIRARHAAGVLTRDGDGFPFEYSLLVAGLLSLDALGGDKSTGLGRCEIILDPGSLRWNGRTISPTDALRNFEEEPEWAEMIELLRHEQMS